MFLKLIFTLLAGLGLTFGGIANSAWLHSHVFSSLTTQSSSGSTSTTTTTSGAAVQSGTAVIGANAAELLLAQLPVVSGSTGGTTGTSAGTGTSGSASTQMAVVPVIVTSVGQGTVQIAPISLGAWSLAGLSQDTSLTVPVTAAAGFSLSGLQPGMHAIARVQGGVVTSLQVQMHGGAHGGLKFLLGGSAHSK